MNKPRPFAAIKASQAKIKLELFILALYFILSPFEYALNFGQGTILKYIAGLFVIIAFTRPVLSNKIHVRTDSIIFIPLALIVLSYVSLLWSINIEQSLRMNQTYMFLQLMFIMVYITKYNNNEIRLLKNAIILGAVLSSIYVFSISPDLLLNSTKNRIAINEADPNEFAALLILALFVILERVIHKRSLISIGLLGLVLLTILLTGSRGAMLSIVISAGIFILVNFNKKSIINYLFLAFVVFIVVRLFLPETIIDRLWNDNKIIEEFKYKEGRTYVWHTVITKVLPEMPIFGYGSGNSGMALKPYVGHLIGTHNVFFSILLEYGILGLPLLLLFLYKIFKKLKIEGDYIKICVFIAILISVMFLDAYFKKYFWNVLMFVVITNSYSFNAKIINQTKRSVI